MNKEIRNDLCPLCLKEFPSTIMKGHLERCKEQKQIEKNQIEKDKILDLCNPKKLQDKMERNNLVLDNFDDKYQKLAFTFYSHLIEIHRLLEQEQKK